MDGMTRETLKLTGVEKIDILGLTEQLKPRMEVKTMIHRENGVIDEIKLRTRIDTLNEINYYKNGGILQHVLRSMLK
jgi:aconitate hydratase